MSSFLTFEETRLAIQSFLASNSIKFLKPYLMAKKNAKLKNSILENTSFLNFAGCTIATRVVYILNDVHEQLKCPICLAPINRNCNGYDSGLPKTCGSKECRSIQGGITTRSKTVEEKNQTKLKREATNLERYGCKSLFEEKQDYLLQCKINKYGQDYKEREVAKMRETVSLLSAEQKQVIVDKRTKTTYNHYGVQHFMSLPENRNNIKTYVRNKFGVDNPMEVEEFRQKISNTYKQKTDKEKEAIKLARVKTLEDTYGVTNVSYLDTVKDKKHNSYVSLSDEEKQQIKDKRAATNLKRYSVRYPTQLQSVKDKTRQTCLKRHNVEYCSQSLKFHIYRRSMYKYDGLKFDSADELYYYIYMSETGHNITKCTDRLMYSDSAGNSHVYFPDFVVDGRIVEIKGSHFFDANGNLTNPFSNDPHIIDVFNAKGECMKKHNVVVVSDTSIAQQYVIEKYTKEFVPLFRTNIPFPYLNANLKKTSHKGLIQHFHKSIYNANRYGYLSPFDAWQDKELVKKSALNRLKYVNRCRPSDVLQGFNVAKIAPKVSVFSPELAKRLISDYIAEDIIVDPFSGFSGRMLGALDCNKYYIGFDLNMSHVKESTQILDFLKVSSDVATVTQKDLFKTVPQKYNNTALFTCPPYSDKECWNGAADKVLTCDEWIEECLSRYDCSTYLFVVDKTEKFNYNIVDTIENKSHFGTNNEYVVLIRKGSR